MSMPSRAYASFLLILSSSHWQRMRSCVNALTGLCLISTFSNRNVTGGRSFVSMPSRAYASFLLMRLLGYQKVSHRVNALTGLCLISTVSNEVYVAIVEAKECQCPHGLMPHFYDRCVDVYVNFGYGGVNALTGLCLISTGFTNGESIQSTRCVNALTGLCLISTTTVIVT